MPKSLNRVTLIGTLGADPEVKATPSGKSVCTLSIATNESYKDQSTGEWKELTDWHRVQLWERLADIAGQYLSKGRKVFIEGKLKTRSYQDKDGSTRYITEVLGRDLILLDSKGGERSQGKFDDNSSSVRDEPNDYNNFSDNSSTEDDDVPF